MSKKGESTQFFLHYLVVLLLKLRLIAYNTGYIAEQDHLLRRGHLLPGHELDVVAESPNNAGDSTNGNPLPK